jgi:hypothetical protein
MAFDGNEGTEVSLEDAARWTKNYRKTIEQGEIIAQFIGKNQLLKLLEQDDCMGVRFYYGINDEGLKNLVAVGADAAENDLEKGIIIEKMNPCPPFCSTKNGLNS